MNAQITKRQKELLAVIYRFIKDEGYPPTFEDMREELGVSSNQSIIDLLGKLEKNKIIKRNEGMARGITILSNGWKVLKRSPLAAFLGTASAGVPIEVLEISGEWQSLPSALEKIEKLKNNVYLLRVSGDSMINAGIENGDLVLVQSQKEFISGDIVLAYIDGEATVKRFISEDKPPYVYLKPENPKYENILFTDNMEIKGKVISIIKNNKK